MHKESSANKHLKKGVLWTVLNRTSVVFMQFSAMIVLARFLTPADFAVMGIAMFFISVSQTLLDSGMGGSLLRKKTIEDVDYSTLFIYNMGVGLLMYLLLLIFANPIATFYNNEELSPIINVIGLSIVISAFGKIQSIILFRELRFKEISIISIISSSIALLTAVIMAIKGFGVWALVMQNLINCILTVVFQFFYNKYFPRMKFSVASFKEQWDFGSHLLYSQLLNTTYQNIFSMIFPKISSYTFSGLYTQANKIQQIPSNIINSVVQGSAFPVLAKIEDFSQFKETNKSFTRKTYLISFSILLGLSIFSKQSIALLLGEKWMDAVPILLILSIGGIGIVVSMMARNTLKSLGITNNILKIEIAKTLIGLIMLAITFLMGDYYILIGIVIANFIASFISIYYLSKVSNYTIREQLIDIILSILPIIPAIVLTTLFLYFVHLENIMLLILGAPLYLTTMILFGFLLKNKDLIQLIQPFISKVWKF